MKKIIMLLLSVAMLAMLFTGCSQNGGGGQSFDESKSITVVSREDGSGTRGAFIELFGIEVKSDDGSKKDMTTKSAVIANQTGVMLTNIQNDMNSIGYVSLGSLNDSVKALSINGIEATTENVKNGTYQIARPFMIATKADVSELTQDFIDFILSKEGQEIVSGSYIAIADNAPAYSGSKPQGKITIAGSSSVTPVMEKLQEAYLAINTNAKIEIQASDSSAGMSAAMDGTCDIGMASRDLKDSEKEQLTDTAIALDGIAVIVNAKNPLSNLTSEQVKGVFTGEITTWSGLNG